MSNREVSDFIRQNNCHMKCVTAISNRLVLESSDRVIKEIVVAETSNNIAEFISKSKLNESGEPKFVSVNESFMPGVAREYESELYVFTAKELNELLNIVGYWSEK